MKKKMSKFDRQILRLLAYYHKNYDVFGNKIKQNRGTKKHER